MLYGSRLLSDRNSEKSRAWWCTNSGGIKEAAVQEDVDEDFSLGDSFGSSFTSGAIAVKSSSWEHEIAMAKLRCTSRDFNDITKFGGRGMI